MDKIKRKFRILKYLTYKKVYVKNVNHIWSFIGAFTGIAILSTLNELFYKFEKIDNAFLVASFGATAVLVFGEIKSPLAQPKNVIFGHIIGATIGITFYKILGHGGLLWLSSALSVATTIVVMKATKTTHPPAGATSLVANIGSEKIKALGYLFVISPILSGAIVMIGLAFLINNISSRRQYPHKQ